MSTAAARILAVGTATPPTRYTQAEVLERFRVANPAVRKLFLAPHVRSRHLYLPAADAEGRPTEDQAALLRKHRKGALALGAQAIAAALEPLGLQPADVDYLCCVSSTGFMLPGISAMYVKHLGFRTSTHRADVVGMGCNAGLNGLNPVAWWAASHPGRLALMVCAEVNSALYQPFVSASCTMIFNTTYQGTSDTASTSSMAGMPTNIMLADIANREKKEETTTASH